ncbi:hypothetical protein DY000_02012785 [Brassica cretica]|uniref:Uncharacterized protein n=1 Tax=Brassica cretica TaxID=69181 RepID=A0ABQ7D4N9_BRACR|nr:hypothetical protein DY000_02012785 [Brassica cretica]
MVMKSGDQEILLSLEHDSQGFTIARAGDNIAIAFQETDAYQVMVMTSGDQEILLSLEHDSQGFTIARAGDNIAIAFQETDAYQVMSGGVLCHPDYSVSLAKHK